MPQVSDGALFASNINSRIGVVSIRIESLTTPINTLIQCEEFASRNTPGGTDMSREAIQELWPHEGTFCYGCGKNNEYGLQLKSFWENEETVATWEPMDHHMAFKGILNGGIIATIIDCHGTGTANAHAHKADGSDDSHFMYVTSGLSVRFLRPTPIDKPVTLRARVTDSSGLKITVTCSLYSGDDKCATGEVHTVRVSQDTFLS